MRIKRRGSRCEARMCVGYPLAADCCITPKLFRCVTWISRPLSLVGGLVHTHAALSSRASWTSGAQSRCNNVIKTWIDVQVKRSWELCHRVRIDGVFGVSSSQAPWYNHASPFGQYQGDNNCSTLFFTHPESFFYVTASCVPKGRGWKRECERKYTGLQTRRRHTSRSTRG